MALATPTCCAPAPGEHSAGSLPAAGCVLQLEAGFQGLQPLFCMVVVLVLGRGKGGTPFSILAELPLVMDVSCCLLSPCWIRMSLCLTKRRLRVREVEKASSQVRWVEAHPLP